MAHDEHAMTTYRDLRRCVTELIQSVRGLEATQDVLYDAMDVLWHHLSPEQRMELGE